MAKRTPTSYLILGLLTARDWTAYELADQLDKGIDSLWSRVSRQYYNVPKRLVEDGLASARSEVIAPARKGAKRGRERTLYSITDAGRQALTEWHTTPCGPPMLQFEGMVRMMFADGATIEDFHANLRTMAEQASASRAMFVGHAQALLDDPDTIYPERRHLFAMANVFCVDHFATIEQFATWALQHTKDWPDPMIPARTHGAQTDQTLELAIRKGRQRADRTLA
ncbi:PadR family transcriptional regulator [Aquihabitans sp. McL0605]|uniref:PadR family transcriptional regulator n=1 Tax=Aquihabitans sp. McL0605 TaxID=3415671 RepID=UPI003CF4F42E